MDGLSKWRNELKYRGFMARLTDQITAQDLEKLKYMLTPLIPEGKKESLNTVTKLFTCLEQMLFVGPTNLENLEELFREVDNPKLCQMLTKFMQGRRTQTTQQRRMSRRLLRWFQILVRSHWWASGSKRLLNSFLKSGFIPDFRNVLWDRIIICLNLDYSLIGIVDRF